MSATEARGRVLIVDDEPLMIETINAVLEEWAREADLELLSTGSAGEARAILERLDGRVDVVISDLIMPGGNGGELLRAIRERWPDIVTMNVSGASDLAEMREVTTAGVFAYLVKPFEPSTLVHEAGKAFEVACLRRENRRHQRNLQGELRWAGELQRAMLRPDVEDHPRIRFSIAYHPLAEFQCGGDFYDIVPAGPDRRLVLIGDVGGHGIRAALVTAFLKALVAPGPELGSSSPGALLASLNRRLCRTLKDTPDLLVTFFAAEIDAANGSLVYAGAGHPPLYLLHADSARPFPSEGPGLGFDPDAIFPEQVASLAPGDQLVLYTDGIREVIPGDKAAAEREFADLLLACRGTASFADEVVARAQATASGARFSDDATVIGISIG